MIVRSLGVLSVGKLQGAMGAIVGLLAGGAFTLMSLAGAAIGGGRGGPRVVVFGVGAILLLPVLYGVAGFISGAITALLYNLVAATIGGIEVHFEDAYTEPVE
jgi:hypothetical protein